MKILKESKEQIPVSFLTDFISDCWEKVGYLKADIESLKDFEGANEVSEVIQSLVDAYLVCLGQLEAHAHDEGYVDVQKPVTAASKEEPVETPVPVAKPAVKKTDSEEAVVPAQKPAGDTGFSKADLAKLFAKTKDLEAKAGITPDPEPFEEPFKEPFNEPTPEPIGARYNQAAVDQPTASAGSGEPFEFFVDFDEPAPVTTPLLTDREIERLMGVKAN